MTGPSTRIASPGPGNVPRRVFEHVDERVPDAATLLFGVVDAGELAQKPRGGVHHPEIDADGGAECGLHLLPLVQAQQPVVHENAAQPVADGAVHQCRGDRRVDAARQAADRPLGRPNERTDPLDLVLDEVARRPVGRAAADREQEVVKDLTAPRRMSHLGVEQHAENGPGLVLQGGDRSVGARGGHAEVRGRLVELVAVARPHGDARLRLESLEQAPPARFPDHHLGAPVFPLAGWPHRAARQVRHQLHPVADAQHGYTECQELRVRGGGAGIEYGIRPARQDDPPRVELPDEREIGAARGGVDLAIHVRLAHAARDQLRELRAVVEDEDLVHDPPWYHVVGSSTSPRSRSSSVSRWRAT